MRKKEQERSEERDENANEGNQMRMIITPASLCHALINNDPPHYGYNQYFCICAWKSKWSCVWKPVCVVYAASVRFCKDQLGTQTPGGPFAWKKNEESLLTQTSRRRSKTWGGERDRAASTRQRLWPLLLHTRERKRDQKKNIQSIKLMQSV